MSAYHAAAHRLQTAIAALMGLDPTYLGTQSKHLRTGLDLSKSDMCGLARLLIQKGIFTEAEYIDAITKAAEDEANSYERQGQAILGHRGIRTV